MPKSHINELPHAATPVDVWVEGIIVLLSSASSASLNLSPARNLTATETTPGRYYRSLADTFCERLPGQLSNELREIVEVLTATE